MTSLAKEVQRNFGPGFLTTLVVMTVLGWFVMLLQHQHGHDLAGPHFVGPVCGEMGIGRGAAMIWLTGWAVMIVAMMVPPALPLLQTVARLGELRSDAIPLLIATALAFIAIWIVAGLVLWLSGTLAARAFTGLPDASAWSRAISGAAAIFAGAYQFSALKKACLTACRSPAGIAMTHWGSAHPLIAAFRIGAHFGAVCVGCCWALMALTFVVGTFAMPLMIAVSLFMLAERLLPSARPLVPLQAGFAILIGILILTGLLPPGFLII